MHYLCHVHYYRADLYPFLSFWIVCPFRVGGWVWGCTSAVQFLQLRYLSTQIMLIPHTHRMRTKGSRRWWRRAQLGGGFDDARTEITIIHTCQRLPRLSIAITATAMRCLRMMHYRSSVVWCGGPRQCVWHLLRLLGVGLTWRNWPHLNRLCKFSGGNSISLLRAKQITGCIRSHLVVTLLWQFCDPFSFNSRVALVGSQLVIFPTSTAKF